jgi:hypothetical protein
MSDVITGVVVMALLVALAWTALNAATWARKVSASLEAVDQRLDDAEAAYRAIPPMSDATRSALRRSLNEAHLEAARRAGTRPVDARDNLEDAARSRGLIRVESDSTRLVRNGRYSVPYLTPAAAGAIDSITGRFRRRLAMAGLPAFKITLSSLWRSAEDQAELARVNVNAARGGSSHEYATTFDIPYRRFEYAGEGALNLPEADTTLPIFLREYVRNESARRARERFNRLAEREPGRLEAALGRTLVTLENDSVILVIREVRQPVYHITSVR